MENMILFLTVVVVFLLLVDRVDRIEARRHQRVVRWDGTDQAHPNTVGTRAAQSMRDFFRAVEAGEERQRH